MHLTGSWIIYIILWMCFVNLKIPDNYRHGQVFMWPWKVSCCSCIFSWYFIIHFFNRSTPRIFFLYVVVPLLIWRRPFLRGFTYTHYFFNFFSGKIYESFLEKGNVSEYLWQAPRFFDRVWCTSTCKHEDRWCYEYCCDIIFIGDCKWKLVFN
jgi:hypothetical protein